jgi:dUTP pyrophosphatase
MINICLTEDLRFALKVNNIDVKDYVPAYNGESAGLDLFNAGDKVTILPQTVLPKNNKTLIGTGLKMQVPKGYVALIQERGSITKTPLKVRAGVIDSGYTGEVFVNLVNVGSEEFILDSNIKLPVQVVVVKCDNQFSIIDEDEYLNITESSQRKNGKIGSSD